MKTYTLKIPRFIVDDLQRGKHFYSEQDRDLGNYFYDTLVAEIESLQFFAGIHSQHFSTYRILSKHFPFAIYYVLSQIEVTIVAVLDMRQNPQHNEDVIHKRS